MSDDGTAGTTTAQGGTPPGWYPDPQGAMRWWDGAAWTGHVAAGSATSVTRTATILSADTAAVPAGGAGGAGGGAGPAKASALAGMPALSRRTWLAAGAVVVVLVLLAGYLLFGRGGDDTAATAGPVVHYPSPQQVVQQVALKNADLKGGLRVSLAKGGSVVTGQTTLGPCGYAYTSEAHRLSRREVTVVTAANQPTGIFNEVVVYDTALAHCPTKAVRESRTSSTMVQFARVRTQLVPGSLSKADEKFDEAVVASYTETATSPRLTAYVLVFSVRRGAVVSYLGTFAPTQVTSAQARVIGALSDVTARRLPKS